MYQIMIQSYIVGQMPGMKGSNIFQLTLTFGHLSHSKTKLGQNLTNRDRRKHCSEKRKKIDNFDTGAMGWKCVCVGGGGKLLNLRPLPANT